MTPIRIKHSLGNDDASGTWSWTDLDGGEYRVRWDEGCATVSAWGMTQMLAADSAAYVALESLLTNGCIPAKEEARS